MDDFYLRRSLIEADYISQKVYYIFIICVSVELCGWPIVQMFAEKDKREEKLEDWI